MAAPIKENVSYDDWDKLDIRVGTVVECEKVKKADKLPEPNPVQTYLASEREKMRDVRQLTTQANNKLFTDQKAALVKAGMAPDKGLSLYTMDEAKALIDAMYKNFTPEGTEIK
jgi:hypothetical protein